MINEDELYSYFIFNRDVDIADFVTTEAVSLPSWLNYDPSSKRLFGTPQNDEVGTHIVSLQVSDLSGASSAQNFSINVINVNDAPTLENEFQLETMLQGTSLNVKVPENTFNDIDANEYLNYFSTLSDGSSLPSWLSFDTETKTFSGTPGNSDVGILNAKLIAQDTGGLEAENHFYISVTNINDAPITSRNSEIKELSWNGSAFSFDLIADLISDPDTIHGDTLTYSLETKEGQSLPTWMSFNPQTGLLTGNAPTLDVRENPTTYQLDSFDHHTGLYSTTDFLRLENYFLKIFAADKAGLSASTEIVLAPNTLAEIDSNSFKITDFPLGSASKTSSLSGEMNYVSSIGNILSLSAFDLDNDNLSLAKDKTGTSWDTATWPTSPIVTFDLLNYSQSQNFGNLGEISIFLGQVLDLQGDNYRTVESAEKYIELKFTANSNITADGSISFEFNPRLEGDIKYQANSSSLNASVSVSQNATLEFVPKDQSNEAKLKINILDLLDQLPFSGAVGALVPFQVGNFYVAIDGLPLKTSEGEFIDLIDAQFTII